MKKHYLTILCILLCVRNYAQNSRPDTIEWQGKTRIEIFHYFDYDTDSARISYADNKKVLTEIFNPDGSWAGKIWGSDSAYTRFESPLGVHFSKMYFRSQTLPKDVKVSNLDHFADSIVYYYDDSLTIQSIRCKKDEQKIRFYRSGQMAYTHFSKSFFESDAPVFLQKREVFFYENGQIQQSKRTEKHRDSAGMNIMNYDSTFYQSGQLFCVKIYEGLQEEHRTSHYKRCQFFDAEGNLTSQIPDDNRAILPFKDNIDCYYGFKTAKGDTVVAPQYDKIDYLDSDRYIAYQGTNITVFRADGRIVPMPFVFQEIHRLEAYFEDDPKEFVGSIEQLDTLIQYYWVVSDNKIGVIDREGQQIIPPQYLVSKQGYERRLWEVKMLGDAAFLRLYFDLNDTPEPDIIILNRQGLPVLPPQYQSVKSLDCVGYFEVAREKLNLDKPFQTNLGIWHSTDGWVLPEKFMMISHLHFTDLVKVTTQTGLKEGLFNLKTRKWVLDTQYHIAPQLQSVRKDTNSLGRQFTSAAHYQFIFSKTDTVQYGLMDAEGRILLRDSFDNLSFLPNGRLWGNVGNRFYVLNPNDTTEKFPIFDEIKPVGSESSDLLAVRRGKKWGVLNADKLQYSISCTYDFVCEGTLQDVAMLKGDQVYSFNLRQSARPKRHFEANHRQKIFFFELMDDSKRIFYTDLLGRVIVPPQYFRGDENAINEDYRELKDTAGNRFLLFNDGVLAKFPFSNNIIFAHTRFPIFIAKRDSIFDAADTMAVRKNTLFLAPLYAVFARNGQLLTPIEQTDVAVADFEKGLFFTRNQRENMAQKHEISRKNGHKLFEIDQNWFLYDAKGQLLNPQPFRYPFRFDKGLGVGMQGDNFGVFRSDGTAAIPPQYPQLWRVESDDLFVAFQNIGLQAHVVLLDTNGKNLLKNRRYDAISDFWGNYAIVSQGDKLGVIDRTGKEVVEPQDLRFAQADNAIDWFLKEPNRVLQHRFYKGFWDLPQLLTEPTDFVKTILPTPLRKNLGHLLFIKNKDWLLHSVNDWRIERAASYNFSYWNQLNRESYCPTTSHAHVTERYISFLLEGNYYNFELKNKRWEDLDRPNFWKKDPLSKNAFYAALVKKIRALPDAEIDCSETAALLDNAYTHFLITQTGIDIHLHSSSSSVVFIAFSWVELEPFLK